MMMVWIILLPLVATIEAVVLARLLGIKPIESFVTSAKANWRSTIAGLPAGWCMALAGLIPAGILAYFLPAPYRDPAFQIIAFTALTGGLIPNRFSMIAMAAACLLLLVPYYVATVRVERKVVEARHPEIDPKRITAAVRWANRLRQHAGIGLPAPRCRPLDDAVGLGSGGYFVSCVLPKLLGACSSCAVVVDGCNCRLS